MPTLTVGAAAVELLERSRLRKSFVVQNEDAANQIYIKRERATTPTVSAADHDHRLGPGGSIALNFGNDGVEAVQDRWTIIASAAGTVVSFFETEDQLR